MADNVDEVALRRAQALRDAEICAREGEDPDLAVAADRPGFRGNLKHLSHLDHPTDTPCRAPWPPERHWRIYRCDLTRYGFRPKFWLTGPHVEGLAAGDRIYVTDTHEEPGDVTVFYCVVSEVRSDGVLAEFQPG